MGNPDKDALKQSLRGSLIQQGDRDYPDACKLYKRPAKRKFDPEKLVRMNQNIRPSA